LTSVNLVHHQSSATRRLMPSVTLNDDCVRSGFVTMSLFLVDGYAYSRSFCGLFGVVSVNIFSLVNVKIVLTSSVNFLSNCF